MCTLKCFLDKMRDVAMLGAREGKVSWCWFTFASKKFNKEELSLPLSLLIGCVINLDSWISLYLMSYNAILSLFTVLFSFLDLVTGSELLQVCFSIHSRHLYNCLSTSLVFGLIFKIFLAQFVPFYDSILEPLISPHPLRKGNPDFFY